MTETFLRMSFTELSIAPGKILEIRKIVCESGECSIKTFTHQIKDPMGLHACPAGQLCKAAAVALEKFLAESL